MAMTNDKRHQFKDEFYGDFAVTIGWQQNFNAYPLSSYFLNKNGLMRVGANAADGRTAMVDVRASDLGLSSTFTGIAWLCPKYQDLIADFDLFTAWDNVTEGLWSELRIPFAHTRWNAGLGTSVDYTGGTAYTTPAAVGIISANQTVNVVCTEGDLENVVYQGNCALSSALLGNLCFGDAPILTAGKLINCTRTTNGLSGIRLSIGYDFLRRERGFLGIALDVECPVANKPHRKNCCNLFMFDPKVGSQNRWLIGGAFFGRYQIWQKDENERVNINFDARAYSGFGGKTTRMLGILTHGNTLFNHYLLLKKFEISEGSTTATYVGLERAANLLRYQVKSKAMGEGQFTVMLDYKKNNFAAGIGYNFYGRVKETLCLCNNCGCNTGYYYVIKGNAPVANAALTYHGGFYSPNDSSISQTGTLVTGSQAAWNALEATTVTENAINFTPGNGNLSLCVAEQPQYTSNTIFAHIGYNWEDADWKPYVSLIGKLDFGTNNTALSLWGLYLKGGFCF